MQDQLPTVVGHKVGCGPGPQIHYPGVAGDVRVALMLFGDVRSPSTQDDGGSSSECPPTRGCASPASGNDKASRAQEYVGRRDW